MLRNLNPVLEKSIQNVITTSEACNSSHVMFYIASLVPRFESHQSIIFIKEKSALCTPRVVELLADELVIFLHKCLSMMRDDSVPVDREDAMSITSEGAYNILLFQTYVALSDDERRKICRLAHKFIVDAFAAYQLDFGYGLKDLSNEDLTNFHVDLPALLKDEIKKLKKKLSGKSIPNTYFLSSVDSREYASISGQIDKAETENGRVTDKVIEGTVVAVDTHDRMVRINCSEVDKPEWYHISPDVKEKHLLREQQAHARILADVRDTLDPKNRLTKTLENYTLASKSPFGLEQETDGRLAG